MTVATAAIPLPRSSVQRKALVAGRDRASRQAAAALLGAAGFAAAMSPSPEARPDDDLLVLLSDAPARTRIDVVQELVARSQGTPVLAAMPDDASGAQLRDAVRAGAAGIVLDGGLPDLLGATALAVAAGQLTVPMSLARRLAPRPLSHREKQILGLVIRGLTNRQIAAELFVAESTVKTHLSSALRKLDARSRAEAAALILDPEEGYGPGILTTDDMTMELT